MVYHNQNYWVFGLFSSSGVLGTILSKNQVIRNFLKHTTDFNGINKLLKDILMHADKLLDQLKLQKLLKLGFECGRAS
jgi:hypothetical protein